MRPSHDAAGVLKDGASPSESRESGESLFEKEWITTAEAAAYLGLTVGVLRNMTSNGQVPYYKLGNRNRYRVVDLRALLLAQRRGGS